LKNNEIGEVLNISRFTAKKYVSSIMNKLEARNRTEAVYIAVKQSIID
jgi:DNA-binding NarL/FixJ family response regulator